MNNLSKKARFVLLALSFKADKNNEVIIGKYELAKITGYNDIYTLRQGVNELKENGIIAVEKRDKNGYSMANKYKILKDQNELMEV